MKSKPVDGQIRLDEGSHVIDTEAEPYDDDDDLDIDTNLELEPGDEERVKAHVQRRISPEWRRRGLEIAIARERRIRQQEKTDAESGDEELEPGDEESEPGGEELQPGGEELKPGGEERKTAQQAVRAESQRRLTREKLRRRFKNLQRLKLGQSEKTDAEFDEEARLEEEEFQRAFSRALHDESGAVVRVGTYHFPVRRGLIMNFELPLDLTPSEAKRLGAFVRALALEPDDD